MKQYLDTVREVLSRGTRKPNRTGVDTLSTFNINYEIDLREGFPLLTTKEISWKNIVVENLWFLSGQTDIAILKRHGCKFWDAWADADGKVPSAYGNFWRAFPCYGKDDYECYPNDQIKWVVGELKRNPMSRRLVVSAWLPSNAQTSKLPPCHLMFVFNVQIDAKGNQSLCCHLTQRSADIALGVPYNIAGYAFLTELVGRFAGIQPGIFAHTLIDAHIYTRKEDGSMAEYDHVPGLCKQMLRQPRALPKLVIADSVKSLEDIDMLLEADTELLMSFFKIENYNPHPAIKFKVAV